MPLYKLTGRVHLANIGRFFRRAGTNIFRFMPGELKDFSEELLEAVKRYVPVDTGTLKSSLVAEANYNSIQVVARTSIMMDSAYKKDYAEYVEAGIFGKDKSRLIKTPEFGGESVVRSPGSFGEADAELYANMKIAQEAAHETAHGYAQFMRAGIYDVMPLLMKNMRRIIIPKVMGHAKALQGRSV
jgi:hypothetical protein